MKFWFKTKKPILVKVIGRGGNKKVFNNMTDAQKYMSEFGGVISEVKR